MLLDFGKGQVFENELKIFQKYHFDGLVLKVVITTSPRTKAARKPPVHCKITTVSRGLHSRMPFPGNQFFPKKNGKFPVPSIWEHPLPGPDSVPAFETGCFPVFQVSFQSLFSNR